MRFPNNEGFLFSIWVFLHNHSQITGLQGKGWGGGGSISLTPHYHFYTLYRHLHISQAITAESSPLHIASRWTRSRNLWLSSTSCKPLNYAPLKGLTLERAYPWKGSQFSNFHFPCNKEESLVLNFFFREYNLYFKKL